MAMGLTQPLTEMSTRNISWGRADNLTTFMCRLSWNLGASTSWNPLGLSRPVMGLLLHYIFRTDLPFIIRSLDTVFTAIDICHTSYADCLLVRSG